MAGRKLISVTESIWVAQPPEVVFDYTQDYARRRDWDAGVTSAQVLSDEPRAVRVGIRGLGSVTVAYRLFRRPERTSAAFVDVRSSWFGGGGGSWEYQAEAGGTRWQQTNSLELKPGLVSRLAAPVIERSLRTSMRTAMAEAKRRLESS
jgi:hypothetical protein